MNSVADVAKLTYSPQPNKSKFLNPRPPSAGAGGTPSFDGRGDGGIGYYSEGLYP
jgi:hypothetical protein